MAAFSDELPGHRFVIDRVAAHHQRSIAHWTLRAPDDGTVMTGTSAGTHADDGYLVVINGFFVSEPAARPRVALVLTSHGRLGETGTPTGFWFEELAAPYLAFQAAGFEVVLASPLGGSAPVDPASLADVSVTEAVRRFQADEQAMGKVESTVQVHALDGTFDAVFLVGGHGTMWDFAESDALAKLLDHTYTSGGVVASVCHGAAGLLAGAAGGPAWLTGQALTGFSDQEEKIAGADQAVPFSLEARLHDAGARYSAGAPFGVHVVRDGQLITGQNPASSSACAAAVVAALRERHNVLA
jgi:putative intracellular protease/amidase